MVKLGGSDNRALQVAQDLAAAGLQVFPAKYRDKFTLVKWEKYQGTDSHSMLERWFKNRGDVNFWVLTGRQSGYVVVDADSVPGDQWWRDQLGDEIMDATAKVKTAKGTHYWFKIPADWEATVQSWSSHPGKDDDPDTFPSFDFRADKTGVIVPPSVHESGLVYEWTTPLSEAREAPAALLDGTYHAVAPVPTSNAGDSADGRTRSMLTRLLSRPPGAEGSGRNDWMARVAGHYAKTYHNQRDLYDAHCEAANAMMGQPLDPNEYKKTIESVWRGEHERNSHRALDSRCGYLVSNETTIQTQVIVRRGEDKEYTLAEYADFDLHAKGVMTDEDGSRTYLAEIVRRKPGSGDVERMDIVLRGEVLGDDRALRKFLARYACTIVPPDNMAPKTGSPGQRVQRYLESQQPPVVEIVPHLGYHPTAISQDLGGYVTHDGVIAADGLHDLDAVSVRADPRLLTGGTAPHLYGFGHDAVVAREVLAETLTFHDEAVASVFGAWWAACLLKPQIEARTSLFPFVAIEAPSESGKTNGFFSMMTQLNGNTRGETQPTKAALRDMAASHRNGIVWVDDLDDPAYLMELLRAATSGGSLTKMGEDRESVKNTRIVSPIVISGEALGLGTQKALVDRAILLRAPSPVGRRSIRDSSRPQWDDVLAVMERFPDGLAALAGWYVQAALAVEDETIAALRAGRQGGSGRAADKVAVLRAGARLLDHLVGHDGSWAGTGEHARRVEAWLSGHLVDEDGIAVISNENALTLELLPWALRTWRFPDKAYAGERNDLDTPAFVRKFELAEDDDALFGDDVEIWFHAGLLSQAWEREKHGRTERRTTTESALKDQADALSCPAKRTRITNGGSRLAYYRQLKGPVAAAVVRRALGQ